MFYYLGWGSPPMIVEQELYGHDLPWDLKYIALGIPR